ncbi:unnamed protein product [Sphagnum jensenii]|uniref:Uncharacterized protein n=1 Tax=Sphagnum jensenii TaxID=128206 RepID=A0ABP1A4D3_9BRYO
MPQLGSRAVPQVRIRLRSDLRASPLHRRQKLALPSEALSTHLELARGWTGLSLILTEWATKVKPNVKSVDFHPQVSRNGGCLLTLAASPGP